MDMNLNATKNLPHSVVVRVWMNSFTNIWTNPPFTILRSLTCSSLQATEYLFRDKWCGRVIQRAGLTPAGKWHGLICPGRQAPLENITPRRWTSQLLQDLTFLSHGTPHRIVPSSCPGTLILRFDRGTTAFACFACCLAKTMRRSFTANCSNTPSTTRKTAICTKRCLMCGEIQQAGYPFHVTVNLHTALLRLRNHAMQRVLWIDAICINQDDQEEKEHQIKAMADIYGNANRVVVWLGEAADDSDKALEVIRLAGDKTSTFLSQEKQVEKTETEGPLLALLQRPWFQRIWVSTQLPTIHARSLKIAT
jgi:hypothetical protein